jgi:HAD superfamily hydrolase (TIGR01509 family)
LCRCRPELHPQSRVCYAVQSLLSSRQCDARASVFDLDGVLTDTARIHAMAWKAVFDAFLQRRAQRQGVELEPFDIATDYLAYVDGRPRHDGIRAFLAARRIVLPEGSDHVGADADTVRAIGERKTALFRQALQKGIDPAPGARELLISLRRAGIARAVASSSRNCAAILHAAGLEHLIDVRADGIDAEELGLPGKPDPALFLEAARRLGVEPPRAVLFEDVPWPVSKRAARDGSAGWWALIAAISGRHCAGTGPTWSLRVFCMCGSWSSPASLKLLALF